MLTVQEVAALLRVSVGAVYDACKRGELRHVRIGRTVRIHRDHLASFTGVKEGAA